MVSELDKGAGGFDVFRSLPASSLRSSMSIEAVPNEPTNHSHDNGVDFAAPPLASSSIRFACNSGFSQNTRFCHAQFFPQPVFAHHVSTETVFPQSYRNRKRRERHQNRVREKAHLERERKRRMIWNQVCRENRLRENQAQEQELVPSNGPPTLDGHVRIGAINMEKSNPEKLEQLVRLASRRNWEIVVVSEVSPTSRHHRQPIQQCRHWKWEGWEMVHTGMVGVLLNPSWSAAWHAYRAPKHRSNTGRVLSVALPCDPSTDPLRRPSVWIVTAVWAPISTSTTEELDEFWDEVEHAASTTELAFSPSCALSSAISSNTLHMVAGDWNAQLYEDPAEPADVLGRYRPTARHQVDDYATCRVMALGRWVHADSHRPAIGNRHRGTWYSAIHRRYYEIDWMLLPRAQLQRLVSMTLRHTTDDLQTQHSAKEYVFRLAATQARHRGPRVPRPDLSILRGTSEAAAEARDTLTHRVAQACGPDTSFDDFRRVVAHQTLTVCGEMPRSCRKPWLRSPAASREIGDLNTECVCLRRTKRELQQALHDTPDDASTLSQLDACRQRHNDLKKQQRCLLRSLERDYWEQVLASHPTQAADSFRFYKTLRTLQTKGTYKAARQNPFAPDEWRDHFSNISSQPESLHADVENFITTLPVSDHVRQWSLTLDADITDKEINTAMQRLRAGAGGGDGIPPIVLKTLFQDPSLASLIRAYVRRLWSTPATEWKDQGLDGPGLQVPLWKQKEPFANMDKWRGVVLLWCIPRVLAKVLNHRGQQWFETTDLPLPESFGFRTGLGTDDALFMIRRLDEEISAWQSFGWNETTYEAGLMDLQKAYPTANKLPFWHLLFHHGVQAQGPFINALRGFHCCRDYCIKTGPDTSPASLSAPYRPARGFGEGDGTSPWAWNVLYSGMVRYSLAKRPASAARRGLACGIPWRWHESMDLCSSWTRKNDGRPSNQTCVEVTVFADDTTLHGSRQELHQSDEHGSAGMDVFAQAVADWGSTEHPDKREVHTYGTPSRVCLVGGGIDPGEAVNRSIQRGLKCWAKIRPALKNSRLSLQQKGKLLMTFLYSGLAYSCKTRATRQRDVLRMQAVMNTACRYLCRTRLPKMREQHVNHSDLRALLGIPTVQAAMDREQMRWLGHVCRMHPGLSTTYAKTFARGTIDVGAFQRQASAHGGRISADRKSLPDMWVQLCHKHGLDENHLDETARDRDNWKAILDRRFAQALFEDRQASHRHMDTLPNPGLEPWSRPGDRRGMSPTARERKSELQRQRRQAAKAQPKAKGAAVPMRRPAAAAKRQPRQVQRHHDKKVYYAGHNQRKVSAEDREAWEYVCDFPGCGLKFETSRALNIHKGKANKPGGTHSQL